MSRGGTPPGWGEAQGEGGINEARGAGWGGYLDRVLRFYKRRMPAGTFPEIAFDQRNEAERDNLILVRNEALFALAPPDVGVSTLHVIKVIEDAGGQIAGRENPLESLMNLTKMGRTSCLNALTKAIDSNKVKTASRTGIKGKTYYIPVN